MFIFRSAIWNRLRCLFDKQLVVGCATGTFISQTFLRDFGMRLSIPLNYVVLFVFAIMIEKAFAKIALGEFRGFQDGDEEKPIVKATIKKKSPKFLYKI